MLWWTIFGGIFVSLILLIIVTLAVGIKLSIYFDYSTMSICADGYVFKRLLFLKLRGFECAEKLYLQLGKGELKEVKKSEKEKKSVSFPFDKLPKINIAKLNFSCVFGSNDFAQLGQIYGVLSAVMPAIQLIAREKIKVKNHKITFYPMYDKVDVNFNSQVLIKFAILKVIYFAIYASLWNKKNQHKKKAITS